MSEHPRHALGRERETAARWGRHHRCDCEECEEAEEQLRLIRAQLDEILSRLPEPDTTPASITLTAH